MKQLFLGVDQGSSATKACLLDEEGRLVADFSKPVATFRPGPDLAEQDPSELLSSVRTVFANARETAKKMKKKIAAAGLACQRSGVCAWSAGSGESNGPLITWADRRFQNAIDALAAHREKVQEKTHVPLLPNYAAPKIARLHKLLEGGAMRVGTLDTFLLSNISAGKLFVTEDTMAARTMLYDLKDGGWDPELCSIFGVDRDHLPAIRSSLEKYCDWEGVPITAVLADQQSALFAAVCTGEKALLNLGSIASLTMHTGEEFRSELGCISGVLFSRAGADGQKIREFVLESVTNACKAVLDFTAKQYTVSDLAEFDTLCMEASDSGHCTAFFPIGGTASPEWLTDLPCVMDSRLAGRSERVRALVENIANFLVFSFERLKLKETLGNKDGLLVSGGASAVNYLLQYLADATGLVFRRASLKEATARGAALAAGVSLGGTTIGSHEGDPGSAVFAPANEKARKKYEAWVDLKERVVAGNLAGLEVFNEG